MTNLGKLSTAASALALGMMMSTTAFAQDMTCKDYNAMTPEDQLAAAQDWNAGREGLRDEARGDDPAVEVTDENVSDDLDVDGGREELRETARGSDEEVVQMMADYCAGGDDLNLKDMRHPTQDADDQ